MRDNDRGLALPREVEVIGSQPLLLLTKAALDDCAASLKAIKRCRNISPRRFLDGFIILLDELPLHRRPRFRGILSADFCQLRGGEAGIHFNRAQRIGCFNRTMLPGVTGEDDATTVRLHEIEKLKHLFRTELTRLINDYHRTRLHRLPRQKLAHGLRAFKTIASQIHHLLTLRRDEADLPSRNLQTRINLAQSVAFSGASTAAKQRHEINRAQNSCHRLALIFVERRIARRVIGTQRIVPFDAVLRHLHNTPLPLQNVASGHLARIVRGANIPGNGGGCVDFGEIEIFPTSVLQGVTPDFVLMRDGLAIKQMILCPCNRRLGDSDTQPGLFGLHVGNECGDFIPRPIGHLPGPKRAELLHSHVLDFSGAFVASNVRANVIDIPGGLFRFARQQFTPNGAATSSRLSRLFGTATPSSATGLSCVSCL